MTKTNTTQFLKDMISNWYTSETMKRAKWKKVKQPSLLDYTALRNDIDSSKFGEYISQNPSKDFKVKSIEIPKELLYTSLAEIGAYLNKTYPGQLAGLDVMEHIYNNPKDYPELADGNYHFFFGSLFRFDDGDWSVPSVQGRASGFDRYGFRLVSGWGSVYRVVLLETVASGSLNPSESSAGIDSLSIDRAEFNKGYLQGLADAALAISNLKNFK